MDSSHTDEENINLLRPQQSVLQPHFPSSSSSNSNSRRVVIFICLSFSVLAVLFISFHSNNDPFLRNLDLYSQKYLVCDSVYDLNGGFTFNVPTSRGCVDFFMSKQYSNHPQHQESYLTAGSVRASNASIVSVCGCEKSGDEIFDATQLRSLFTSTKQSIDTTPTILYISTGPDTSVTIFNSAGKTFVIGTIYFPKK